MQTLHAKDGCGVQRTVGLGPGSEPRGYVTLDEYLALPTRLKAGGRSSTNVNEDLSHSLVVPALEPSVTRKVAIEFISGKEHTTKPCAKTRREESVRRRGSHQATLSREDSAPHTGEPLNRGTRQAGEGPQGRGRGVG